MKSTVEQLSPTRVRINVEVPFEELKPDFDKAYKALAQQSVSPASVRARLRPSCSSPRRPRRRAGAGRQRRTAGPLLGGRLGLGVKVIGQPEIDITKLEDGQELVFTAEVDVRPEITLPDFSTVAVTVDPIEVTEEAVAEQLLSLRQRFGTLKGVEREVQDGDFVSIDLSATVDGEAVPEATASGLSHEVGSGQLIEGLDEAIIGVKAGESKDFTSKLVAGDFAGQEAVITVTVNSVKERELPEADDEFAQMASEFDTLADLEADLRERVARVRKVEQAGQIRDKVLESLLETVEVPLPEAVVKAEVDAALHDAIHGLDHSEEKLNELLEAQGTTREQFDADAKEAAERSVKTQLLLDAIADAAGTTVGQDELTERILFQAQRYGMAPEQFIQQIQQANQLGAVFADVRRGKALAGVVDAATVTDTAGETIDTAEMFGTAEPAADEAEGDEAAEQK